MLKPADVSKVYSISSLTKLLKTAVESRFIDFWVRGEVSNLTKHNSGHYYFSLKDPSATLSAVCFRRDASRLSLDLKNGMQILAYGRLSIYEPHGKYQLIASHMEVDGKGKLQLQFEQLKRKLQSEGLFDASKKKPIPLIPEHIALITSPTGAAVRDFISILKRRSWSGTLTIVPVKVQGSSAASDISSAIGYIQSKLSAEIIVITRGGGSIEDLWPFNDESLARTIFKANKPIISAVGHEIDFTLADFVADRRAETPSAAAELISSNFLKLRDRFDQLEGLLIQTFMQRLEGLKHHLALRKSDIMRLSPINKVAMAAARFDDLSHRLDLSIPQNLSRMHQSMKMLDLRFQNNEPTKKLETLKDSLRNLSQRLEANSHDGTLKKGYAMLVDDASQQVLSSIHDIQPNIPFRIQLKDGSVTAKTSLH